MILFMNNYDDKFIFFSQLLSGIFLFKKEVNDSELFELMSNYENTYNTDVVDDEFNDLYKFIDIKEKSVAIKNNINHNTIVVIKGKKMTLKKFLINNTTYDIINYLNDKYEDKTLSNNKLNLFNNPKKKTKQLKFT